MKMMIVPAVLAVLASVLALGGPRLGFAQEGTPEPDEPVVVPYVDEAGQEIARLLVEDVVDPLDEEAAGAEPDEDERFSVVVLTVANTGDVDLTFDPATILLRDDEGFLYGPDDELGTALGQAAATPTAGDTAAGEFVPFDDEDLAPDDARTGAVGFEVREDAELREVLFVPETGRLLVLAELAPDADTAGLTAEEEETPTATAPATATRSAPTATAEPTEEPEPTPEPEPTVAPDPDTDEDGLTDGEEAELGTSETAADTDGDGVLDGEEIVSLGTDPFLPDTDGDGLDDADEARAGTDGAVADTDGDGLGDADELNFETDPFVPDTDGDGILDGPEVIEGTDPLAVAVEETPTAVPDVEPTAEPTAAVTDGTDSDGDGLSDAEEQALGSDPAAADSDADGLPDGDEVSVYGTSPLNGDTDGDGVPDITEVTGNSDPLDPAST